MLEPKIFYRKLDSLLAAIGNTKADEGLLEKILLSMESAFGADLRIDNGRIYEQRGDKFMHIYPPDMENALETIPADDAAVQAVVKSQLYIFDHLDFRLETLADGNPGTSIPVAVLISSPDTKWMVVFDLTDGWSREEIEFSFNAIRRAIDFRLLSELVESEFQQAARIQQSLLPADTPTLSGYEIGVYSHPAELVGGDLYDFYSFDDNEFGVCIGDASGHGLPAALMARDVVTGLRMGVEKHMKIVHIIKKLNEVIYKGSYATSFISLFFAEVEANGNLFFMNAGHPHPVLLHGSETQFLQTTGVIIGAFQKMDLSRGFTVMKPGAILVLYSDGIIERVNAKGEFFGVERLIRAVKRHKDLPAKDLVRRVFAHADKFSNYAKWEDDATLLILKRDADKK